MRGLILVGIAATLIGAEGDGSTPLHWASYRDDLEAADRLIRSGANVNAANDLGVTPLWTACENGSSAMVRRLLEAGANPNVALLNGETPLMVAARSGFAEIAEQLLAAGASTNTRATRAQTALMWAASRKHPGVVKVLLAHGADVHARSETWSQMMAVPPHGHRENNRLIPHGGMTALLFAARSGDLASAKLLVAAGANVNDADASGITPAVFAAHSGFTDLVEFFLDKGADPNLAKAGFTALHAAIMHRDRNMAAALLSHGADPNAPIRNWTPARRGSRDYYFPAQLVGATPFWLAARFTQPEVLRLLLKHGADARFVHRLRYVLDNFKYLTEATTPLMAAVGMGGGIAWVQPSREQREALTLETVKLLLEIGVDPNAANTDGRTARDAAKTLGYESVIKLLAAR